LLAYFSYFERQVGLWDHIVVCESVCMFASPIIF
jgi:hypothetical protein